MNSERVFGEVDVARVRGWGNHHRKYTEVLERYFAPLVEHARPGALTFVGAPADPAAELRYLRDSTPEPAQALRLCGAYYSYHFLTLNQRTLDALQRKQRLGAPRAESYREVMSGLADASLSLARAYVATLLEPPGGEPPRGYLFCNVGAAWDHEDLDVWAIARTRAEIPRMGALCSRLASESLRYAHRVQFYLSELLAGRTFAGTLDDYRALLDRDLESYVGVTQVLQATPLAGDLELFADVRNDMHRRYFASEPPTANHEGFLRGALTEIESLTALHSRVGIIDPKAEVYRLCRLLFTCGAARFSLPQTSPWELCARLASHQPERALHLEAVGRAFDFAEVLRYLFALFHAQETPIVRGDAAARTDLLEVAGVMGYAVEREPLAGLMRDYQAHRGALRAAARVLGGDLATYVKSMSVFYRFFDHTTRRTPFDQVTGNVAKLLLRPAPKLQHVFWEDLVPLCQEHPLALQRWVKDLTRLHGDTLGETVRHYARFMQNDVARFVEFLLLLQDGEPSHRAIAELIFDEALRFYAEDEESLSRFTELFHTFPQLVARFVEREDPETTTRLVALFRQKWDQRRYRKAGVRLLSLLNLYHFSSNYSRRQSGPVLARYPTAITCLDDFEELSRIAATAFTDALTQRSHVARRQRLGDFYDLEFCRLSLMTLSGVDSPRVGREFRRSSTRYVAALFESCVEEVAYATGRPLPRDHEGFALFATGGNAREDPYDIDYDMFALLSDAEPERRRFYNRVLARLTRALMERGIVPHNRFTDRFGAYVATLDELRAFIARGEDHAFIEKTELLGSQVVAGDASLDAALTASIIVPHVFGDASYPAALLGEIRARRSAHEAGEMEVKEAPGGLRDTQLFLSILKHRARLCGPESPRLYDRLCHELPALAPTLREMQRTTAFLKRVRDVYRLTVVSEEALEPAYFAIVALFLGYSPGGKADEEASLRSLEDGAPTEATSVWRGGVAEALLRDYRDALARMRAALQEGAQVLGLSAEGL